MPRIELVDNRGPNTLGRALLSAFRGANDVALAAPFVEMAAIRALRPSVEGVARKGRVRILVGVSPDAFNDPEALRALVGMETPEHVQVRVSKLGQYFHEKMWLAKRGRSFNVFVGSSNLTSKALYNPSEMNVHFSGSIKEPIFRELWGYFEQRFRTEGVPLSHILPTYFKLAAKLRRRQPPAGGIWSTIRKKLGAVATSKPLVEPVRWWQGTVEGFLSARTERIVNQYANWRNYDYWSCRSRKLYEGIDIGDRLFLLEIAGRRRSVSIQTVIDKARVRTSEGQFFIAYCHLGRRKKLSTSLKEQLDAGMFKLSPIPLSRPQIRIVRQIFNLR